MTVWHDRKKAVKKSGLPASDRSVYLHLLGECAYTTGEMPARWSPKVDEISDATGVSPRQVQYSLRHLERHGWLKLTRTSRNYVATYALLAGSMCDCTGRRHVPARAQPRVQPRAQPINAEGAVSAPSRVQPKGATPQVKGGFAHRNGQEECREGEITCIGGCGKPARRSCETCWEHASLEPVS